MIEFIKRMVGNKPAKQNDNHTILVHKPTEHKPKQSVGIFLANGYQWNPLLKYPRNELCFCKSKKKFKHCCLKLAMLAVETESAEKAASAIKHLREKRSR